MSDARRLVEPTNLPIATNGAAAYNPEPNTPPLSLLIRQVDYLTQSLGNHISSHARVTRELQAEKNAKAAIKAENEARKAYIARLEQQLSQEQHARLRAQQSAQQAASEGTFFEERYNEALVEKNALEAKLAQVHQLLTHTQEQLRQKELQFRDSQNKLGQAQHNLNMVNVALQALQATGLIVGSQLGGATQALRSPQGRM